MDQLKEDFKLLVSAIKRIFYYIFRFLIINFSFVGMFLDGLFEDCKVKSNSAYFLD